MMQIKRTLISLLLAAGITSASAETIYVTNGNDSGAGSLRQAINDANANSSATTILINIPGALGSERIINVPTALPAFTAPVDLRIDGAQTGKAVLLAPVINGPGATTTGITFAAGSAGSSVQFITFRRFVFSVVLNTYNILVANNAFENNQGGIDVRANSGASTINSNQFSTTNSASAIAGVGGGLIITNNTFTGEGINLGGGGNTIGGAGNADPNVFTNVAGDAILLSNGSGSVIKRNNINGSTGIGINVTGTDITIESNSLSGNVGYDIKVEGGHSNRIRLNQITGDNGMFNGILAKNGLSYNIDNNFISGAAIELEDMSSSSWYGGLRVTSNSVVNDPTGFSGHGAVTLYNTTNAFVFGNFIHHNASNGVLLYNSNNNTIRENFIYENFRAGVNVGTSLYNKITKNYIYYNHADVYGGKTAISTTSKAAPVVTSAKRVGLNFIVSGTGTVANDTVEVFLSDAASRNNNLTQNATSYKASVKATGSTWTVTFPVGALSTGDIYFSATATDANSTTSTLSKAAGVEINGLNTPVTGSPIQYSAESIPGASYSWWTNLATSSVTSSGNTASFTFSQPGSGTVSVGYTDPGTGTWKQYSYAVTVSNPLREGADALEVTFEPSAVNAYPNPFASSVKVSLDAIAGETANVVVFNAEGGKVYSSEGNLKGSVVELGSDLKAGVYTLQITSDNIVKTSKIVKMQ